MLQVNRKKLEYLLWQRKSEIAAAAKMDASTLYLKVRGDSEFKVSELNRLADALKVPVTEFVSIS